LFHELLQRGIDAHLLIIGGGAMEGALRGQIESAGLTERVAMVGDQADVVPFLALTDCLLFPSLDEGLGIVALEGQAMGTPTVASDFVPTDVSVIPGMVEFLSLGAPLAQWVAAVQAKLNQPRLSPIEAVPQLQASDFSVERCLQRLCAIYRGATAPNVAVAVAPDGQISNLHTAAARHG